LAEEPEEEAARILALPQKAGPKHGAQNGSAKTSNANLENDANGRSKVPRNRIRSRRSWPITSLNNFTLLPGVLPAEATMQPLCACGCSAARSCTGLPVNEERAGEWIQVDLLLEMTGCPKR